MIYNRVKRTRKTVKWMKSLGRKSIYEWTEKVKGKKNRDNIPNSVDKIAGKGTHGFLSVRRSKERGVYSNFEEKRDMDGNIYHVKKKNINPNRGDTSNFRGIKIRKKR